MTRREVPRATVDAVWERDQGSCAKCGRGLHRDRRGEDWSIHHRAGRGETWSNLPGNLLTLCGDGTRGCHGYLTAHPAAAKSGGFSCNRLGIIRPADIPVAHSVWGVCFLLNEITAENRGITYTPPE